MALSIRYYGKKRNNRRTGSPVLARLGELLFFAVFLLMGVVGTVAMVAGLILPEWRVRHEFVETDCKVLDKRIIESDGSEGPVFQPQFKVEYTAGGDITSWCSFDIHQTQYDTRDNAQAILNQFNLYVPELDNRYPCWYDPSDPYTVVLQCKHHWWIWLLLCVPVTFVVIGSGGLIYALLRWGKSAERRAAGWHLVQPSEFLGLERGSQQFPFVPQGADMTNSPGTRLQFRLPMANSPGWALLGLLAFCLVWNAIVLVFVGLAVSGHIAGRPDWFLTLFIIPFLLIGLGAVGVFIRQLLIATGIGPTLVEISAHPLHPGDQCRVFLSQAGRLTVNSLRLSLVCEEKATYRQGTNTRTEVRTVHNQEFFRREGFEIQSGLPFETEIDLTLPHSCMHSFKSEHNEIAWSLRVDGDVAGWPNFSRSFIIIVHPVVEDADR